VQISGYIRMMFMIQLNQWQWRMVREEQEPRTRVALSQFRCDIGPVIRDISGVDPLSWNPFTDSMLHVRL